MRGWSARRRVTALVIFTGSAYTLLALTVPWARTALVNPAARVAIETGVVAAMCGAALLMTLLERQRRPSGRDAFIAALVVQAGVNVAFGIIPALLGDQPGLDRTFYPWLAGRYVAGFLLLAAALRTRPAPAGVTVVASLLAVVAVEVAISVVDPSVPVSGVDPRAVTPLGLAWLLEAGPLVMFAAGAVAAGRYAEQSGEPLEFWLSLALAVGAFTQVHQAAFPAALGATITSSDLLRAASAVLLLGGVVRQVVQLKVQRDQAVWLLQRDLESSRRALQEAREAREREAAFMSVVGHELASPIAVINAQTHLLQHSPDGAKVVTASRDKSAIVWNATTGAPIAKLIGHTSPVMYAAFSPDGNRIITASSDKTARIWDAKTGTPEATLAGHKRMVVKATFSPDGSRVVTAGSDESARIWDVSTGAAIITLEGHERGVRDAAFSPDGARIVTGSSDRTARIWDSRTGALLLTLGGHGRPVMDVAFSTDGKRVVSGAHDKYARIWDAATGKLLLKLANGSEVQTAEFSPDGQRLLTASFDGVARIWNVGDAAMVEVQ